MIEGAGYEFRLTLPHVGFNRRIGEFARAHLDPAGKLLDADAWRRQEAQFLPTTDDGDYLATLMQPVREPGRFAGWIAPPKAGVDGKPGDFEYVKIDE